jgi:hypothetical protein
VGHRSTADPSWRRAAHLLALSGFAVGQPLLDLLGREPGFFVARGSGAGEIAVVVCGLLLLPPVLAWASEALVGILSTRGRNALHLGWVALLVALALSPPLQRVAALPATAVLSAAAVCGLAFAVAYARARRVRQVVTVLALAPPLFAAAFLAKPPVWSLLSRGDPGRSVLPAIDAGVPVVVVVFDEFPLLSLLDATGSIDARRYPSFARLARQATWFRNASTVGWTTHQAIPAIVTGRYPGELRRLPTAVHHPDNLFRLFENRYPTNVVEPRTQLSETGKEDAALPARAGSLVSDLGILYAHNVLPIALRDGLPPVDRTWRDFAAVAADDFGPMTGREDRPRLFREFVSNIRTAPGPGLNFLHSELPHSPWQYYPSGRRYAPARQYGSPFGRWADDPWWSTEAWRRHLLQVALADRLLGELLDHLERIGIYERSLVIVVADHGISFAPGTFLRVFQGGHGDVEILAVPLLIKRPHQRSGAVEERNAELIDIAPTVAHVLGIRLPWETDGCALFDPACPERPRKVAFSYEKGATGRDRALTYPAVLDLQPSVERKLASFGSDQEPFRFGPHVALLGAEVDAFRTVATPVGRARLKPASLATPLRIEGVVELDSASTTAPIVAVALDGRIASVVPAPSDGHEAHRLATLLPEESLRGSDPELGIFLVEGSDERPTLHPLVIE